MTASGRSRVPRLAHGPRTVWLLYGGVLVLVALPQVPASPLWWLAWGLQFIAWPQVAYWRALRAADPKRAEMQHVHADAACFGAWLAVVGFQPGVAALFWGSTALTHLALGGPRAFGRQVLLFGAGALAGGVLTGFEWRSQSDFATDLMSLIGLVLVMLVVGFGTYRQNRQLLKVKQSVESHNQRLESLLAASTRIHRADTIDRLIEQALSGLDDMLGRPGVGLVLADPKRPGAWRHAGFHGLAPERGLAAVAARHADAGLDNDDGLMLLPLAPQLTQLEGTLIVAAPTLSADMLSLVHLFRDQVASVLESGLLTLKLQRLAHTDALTGTYNRAYFALALEQAVRNKEGPAGIDFTVLNIDVNGLKPVNDRHGHPAGDALIVCVAKLLRQSLRDSDELCRVGGDEFCVLCHGCDSTQAQAIAARIAAAQAEATLELEGGTVLPVSVSLGHASSDEVALDDIVRTADERMYTAKQAHYQRR